MDSDTTSRLHDLRRDYRMAELDVPSCPDEPLLLFRRWIGEARSGELAEPNAMTLCTVDAHGRPSARMVLLKEVESDGLVFYTNYSSRKGEHLRDRPHAALVFWWEALERQVRVEGPVEPVEPARSDAYFQARPRGSQLGAWASPQSQIVDRREDLDRLYEDVEARFPGDVPRPPHWGGYRVRPERVEFWQGRSSRMHDRIEYLREAGVWSLRRLAP